MNKKPPNASQSTKKPPGFLPDGQGSPWSEDNLPDYNTLLVKAAKANPTRLALKDSKREIHWQALDVRINQIANALINHNVKPGDHVSILGANSVTYAEIMFGIQRIGACITPLPNLASADTITRLMQDCKSKVIFATAHYSDLIAPLLQSKSPPEVIEFDSQSGLHTSLEDFLSNTHDKAPHISLTADMPFNLIYSSGTTGLPKGILHDHAFRVREYNIMAEYYNFLSDIRTLTSTPFYSNTTLYYFFALMAMGGTIHIMEKFDCEAFLQISEQEKITNVVLTPIQYDRLLRHPTFDDYNLSSYEAKSSTSAPFHADLKRELLTRWPAGGLIESWGMTEGGPGSTLLAHEHPDKLDTVGQINPLTDIKIIDDNGLILPQSEIGELVGWCPNMMMGYLNREDAEKESSWYDEAGKRYHRSGDIGWIDEDGFIHLLDRKKDMIISGGFNIYPTDLENCLREHAHVQDVAVVGVPCAKWGEKPVAFVVPHAGTQIDANTIKEWANARLGKVQRISELKVTESLPRSPIGKVLKTQLRDALNRES